MTLSYYHLIGLSQVMAGAYQHVLSCVMTITCLPVTITQTHTSASWQNWAPSGEKGWSRKFKGACVILSTPPRKTNRYSNYFILSAITLLNVAGDKMLWELLHVYINLCIVIYSLCIRVPAGHCMQTCVHCCSAGHMLSVGLTGWPNECPWWGFFFFF